MNIFDPAVCDALRGLHVPLLAWYDQNKRDMPWRGAADSYHVWLSEIMLQQTRVKAVRAYYERFTAALPTLRDLALCDEDTLLKLWEGLGYYNRVRNLQRTAKIVMEEHGGELPHDYGKLLALPGIGEYTAGAVASIAYGIPVPCVDGNVMRVLSRLAASAEDTSLPAVKQAHRVLAQSMIPADRAGDFNQSLMELGALVCLPNGQPLCGSCPLQDRCAAFLAGNPLDYPVKAPKPTRKLVKKTVCVLICGDRVLLWQRPADGLLAGLWEFFCIDGWVGRSELTHHIQALGLVLENSRALKPSTHIFTHLEWRMHGFIAYTADCPAVEGARWVTLADLRERYALPGALKAYSDELERWAKV